MSRTRRRIIRGEPWAALVAEVVRSTPRLDGALCVTESPALFDAESPDDAAKAIAVCRACPARSACKAWLAESSTRWAPRGVVGGQHRPWPRPARDDEHDLMVMAG
jgi:WhiB family redox-sensing transcriptional regulator